MAFEQVHDDRAVEDQHGCGQQEAAEVPAPEHRTDQPETEDHARWRPEHGDDSDRMGERIVNMAAGQGAADGHVDPVDDRKTKPGDQHDVPDAMRGAEVAGRDHGDPQRGQRQQIKRCLGSRFIGGQPVIGAAHLRFVTVALAQPLCSIVHGH